jgi:DNA-binding transcriptional ArsR family regulator
MGMTRNELYAAEHIALAEKLKAIAHPARLMMVAHMMNQEDCINAGFVELTGLRQPTVTRHLGELVAAGLVSRSCGGGYCINPEGWRELEAGLGPIWSEAGEMKPHCNTGKC